MLPFIDFGTLNKKMPTKKLDWLQFTRKINQPVIDALHTIFLT